MKLANRNLFMAMFITCKECRSFDSLLVGVNNHPFYSQVMNNPRIRF
jgi:hypothetical protein